MSRTQHTMHPILPLYLDVDVDRARPTAAARRTARIASASRCSSAAGTTTSRSASPATRTAASARSSTARCCRTTAPTRARGELSRELEPWNFDAHGNKGHQSGDRENFMTVDYMDLHVLEPACGIGLHRHRDNQEIFFMLEGEGIMVIGDWADSGRRTRSFEVRRLRAGPLRDAQGWQPPRPDEPRRRAELAVHVRRIRLTRGRRRDATGLGPRARRALGRRGHELRRLLDGGRVRRRGRAVPRRGRRRRRRGARPDGRRPGHLVRLPAGRRARASATATARPARSRPSAACASTRRGC